MKTNMNLAMIKGVLTSRLNSYYEEYKDFINNHDLLKCIVNLYSVIDYFFS